MGEAELLYKNKRKFDELLSKKENESEEVELSLSLSLNGRFGIDPNRPDNAALVRSSSVADFIFTGGGAEEADTVTIDIETVAGLGRTVSLPAATDEDWRRRKEVQSIRRMEARRKRVEKMKIGAGFRMAARDPDRPMGDRHVAFCSQSSGSTECGSELVTNQGSNTPLESRSTNQNEQKQTLGGQNTEQQSTTTTNKMTMKNMMSQVDMPCVSTRGVGPSGKRIEGFLYRYKKGKEVRIVCVCHGSFLSPAEFVKHAGGGDVSHPLKHIVVNPSPLM